MRILLLLIFTLLPLVTSTLVHAQNNAAQQIFGIIGDQINRELNRIRLETGLRLAG